MKIIRSQFIFISILFSFFLISVFISSLSAADSYLTFQYDNIEWDIKPAPNRLLAIGDLHGDFNALVKILEEMHLVNERGKWTGEKTVLVIVGDYTNKGDDTRYIMDFLMNLERNAGEIRRACMRFIRKS